MQPQPLVAWREAQRRAVLGRLEEGWRSWVRDWTTLGTPMGGPAEVSLLNRPRADRWLSLGSRGGARAWLGMPGDVTSRLAGWLFGAAEASARASGAQAVASRAWEALADQWCGALGLERGGSEGPPPDSLFRAWSGALAFELPEPLDSVLLLDAHTVGAIATPPAAPASKARPIVSLREAVAPLRTTMRVELRGCELDIASIADLRVGDIVPLDHALDAPMFVVAAADVHVADAYLGRRGAWKAIELARADSHLPLTPP